MFATTISTTDEIRFRSVLQLELNGLADIHAKVCYVLANPLYSYLSRQLLVLYKQLYYEFHAAASGVGKACWCDAAAVALTELSLS